MACLAEEGLRLRVRSMGIVISFIIGALLASFAGVIAERLGTGESWVRGRSHCNACNRTLQPLDLVPILSYVLSIGRCRTCTARIPLSYAISELLLGAVFALLYVTIQQPLVLFLFFAFTFLLAVLVLYDLRHTIVPFRLSLVLVVLGGLIATVSASSHVSLAHTFLIAGGIAVFFYGLHVFSKGRWMGLGDTPVALALSLAVGSSALPGLLYSFWSGSIVGIVLLVLRSRGRTIHTEIPFVPFLAFGYLIAFFIPWNPFVLM